MATKKRQGIFAKRRQRRISRRRDEILKAAARIFAEKGYAGSTTKEIAAQADIAEGTLYNYFDGKREILLAIVNASQAPLETMLQEVRELRGREDVIALAEKIFDALLSQTPFTRTVMMEAWLDDVILQGVVMERMQRIGQHLQAFITARIAARDFRPVDPILTSWMVIGMFSAIILPILRGHTPSPSLEERHALAEAAVDMLLDGIRVREG
ncbi:MAG: TetR/AcrR family transcriptional regulator [Chloroflexota bacterium]|nr:TetR/AcrR family transcriptional regulator [Chloroflexota bacterium]